MLKIVKSSHKPNKETLAKAQEGWTSVLDQNVSDFHRLLEFSEMWNQSEGRGRFIKKTFSKLCVVGIGGSSLGPKVICDIFKQKNESILFFENVDPTSFKESLEKAGDLSRCHWLITSKSGKTLETLSQLSLICSLYDKKKLKDHFTVVSDPGKNPLTEWAQNVGVLHVEIPPKIGGRFSVLTPVGLIPAAFLGLSFEDFKKGISLFSQRKELICEVASLAYESFVRGEDATVFWHYTDRLKMLGEWIQQLWAESLGKSQTRGGKPPIGASVPLPLVGAQDQHSVLQQIAEGKRNKFVWIFGVNQIESECSQPLEDVIGLPGFMKHKTLGNILRSERLATCESLLQRKISVLSFEIERIDEETLAFLFMFYMQVVAVLAEMLDINAFDQPGVELGKRLAYELLEST